MRNRGRASAWKKRDRDFIAFDCPLLSANRRRTRSTDQDYAGIGFTSPLDFWPQAVWIVIHARLGLAQPGSRHPCMVEHLGAPSSGLYGKSPEFGSCRVDAGQVDAGAGAGAGAGGREEAGQQDHAT
ncbi:hypothetical protein S40285_10321 [Stachybotrys chlorohalonatus IBT 40285]|uniref:Uncharacterized protein n=1 Tax=Stachybotrys chlorohalonatus (strain IBT 40285) TaxID=1283841 RepID=A0A084QFI4_STAC4|nr:hypothetical protein S40285_10321 [Stachybotrys chlorohalonata IBT 40285]